MSDESDASPPGSPVPSPVASIASTGSPTASPKPSTPPPPPQAEPSSAGAHRKPARAALPDDFGTLVPVGSKRPAHELATQRAKANGPPSKKLSMPSTPVDLEADGRPALLQSTERADADELYTEQEKALSEYLKLHPMLSLEATNHRTLQLVGDLVEQSSIPTRELEVVGKAYDDAYLRAPDVARGERPCCMGEKCICVWLARWRYGDDTEKAFVGAEFLLPSQRRAFDESGALPAIPGKCLVCTRYATTFLYRLARSDPAFRGNVRVPVTAFGNAMLEGDSVPTHASLVNSEDGYRRDALLFVDEAWADSPAARGPMGSFLFRPCVKFVSTHYTYVVDPDTKRPRLIQTNVGANTEADSHFRQPASSKPSTAAQKALA